MKILPVKSLLILIYTVFLPLLSVPYAGYCDAQQDGVVQDIQQDAKAQVESSSKIIQPRENAEMKYPGERGGSSMIWSAVLFIFMLIVIAGFWIYNKRGGSGLRKLSTPNELNIRETKALGNRQFLVVVEYGEQRMLLGVAPGVINHLCYLETPEETPDIADSIS